MALLMLRENATVTICHSRTADLKAMCKQAAIGCGGDVECLALGQVCKLGYGA